MHWEEAALSKGIWHAEKRCPAEVFVKPKNKQREATNLLHVYIIEAALQAERQLPEALPIKTTTLTCHTHSYSSVNYFSQPFHFQQFQEFRTRYLYVKKKKGMVIFQKTGELQGSFVMIRLSFLWCLFLPSVFDIKKRLSEHFGAAPMAKKKKRWKAFG